MVDFKNYVYDYIKDGQKYELKKIIRLLEILGNPQKKFKAIHVSGTNGKGSTSTYLENIFRSAGYNVGKFTSPHLVRYTERVRYNLQEISSEDFNTVIPVIDKAALQIEKEFGIKPSFFETVTAIAYYYFAWKKVDIAVVEVGLGGRLDATNTLDNSMSIVTNVDKDHTGILGKQLTSIAKEKVAILHKNSVLVSAEKRSNIREIFKKHADSVSSRSFFYGSTFKSKIISESFDHTIFNFYSDIYNIRNIRINMAGRHQVKNACGAIYMSLLNHVKPESIIQGLENAFFPGRLEIISQDPLIIMDGAHNKGGLNTLDEYINKFFSDRKLIFLSSLLRDKDANYIFKRLSKYTDTIYLTYINNKRIMLKEDMLKYAGKYFKHVKYFENSEEALKESCILAEKSKSTLFITGSLYLLGELKSSVYYQKNFDKA